MINHSLAPMRKRGGWRTKRLHSVGTMPSGSDVTKQRYEAFLAAVATHLAPHGFDRTGHKFRRPRRTEWLFVDLERGRNSDRDHTLLRAYVGLTSDAIARFLGYRRLSRRPSAWEITAGIGDFFVASNSEPWWLIETVEDPEWCAGSSGDIVCRGDVVTVAANFAAVVIDQVLPGVERYVSDEAIRDQIRAGARHNGRLLAHHFQMAILTARFGPPDAFEHYAAEILASRSWPNRYYEPQLDRLRRGDFFAPGFAPGEKGDKPIKPGQLWPVRT